MAEIAATYGIEDALVEQPAAEEFTPPRATATWPISRIRRPWCGHYLLCPMDYKEEGSDEWIGFDADLAKLFAESLGVSVEFQEITWDYKVEELDSRAIDCVWNGMTLTDDVLAAMGTSNPYCTNYQTLSILPTGPLSSRA